MMRPFALALALVAGCADPAAPEDIRQVLVLSEACPTEVVPIDADDVGPDGVTGQQIYDEAVARLATIEVAWQPERTPSSDTFTVDFGPPITFAVVTRYGGFPCDENAHTSVEVATTAELVSAEGDVSSAGPVRLSSTDLEVGVFLEFDHSVSATGVYREEIDSAFLQIDKEYLTGVVHRYDSDLFQVFALGVHGVDADGHNVASSFYRCYEDEDDDCFSP